MLKNDENQIISIIKYLPPVIILIVSALITFLIYIDYSNTLKEEKKEITQTYIKDHKAIIKRNVVTAVNYIQREFNTTDAKLKKELKKELKNAKAIVTSIYERNKDEKTKGEITKLIKDALKDFRFNDNRGYFFINQMNGIRVFHPIFPEKEGENIFYKKDASGEIRFQKVKKVIEEKGKGFTTFYFFNPKKKNEQQHKLAYVEYFEPYDWMIGTGEYIEEFEKTIQKRALQYLRDTELGKNSYYFVMDYKGSVIMHPRKNLQGKNIYKDKTERLYPFFDGLKKQLKYSEGFYKFDKSIKPNTEGFRKKTYFFKVFTRWQWIVLTGFYEEDVAEKIQKKQIYLEQKYRNYLNTMLFTSLIATLGLLAITFYVSKILERKFKDYRKKLHKEISRNVSQKNKLEKAQEVAKIGDWELDLNTMKAFWSDQVLKILGLETRPKEVGPSFLKTIMHEDDWPNFESSVNNTLKTGAEHKCKYRIYRPDGEIRWIDCRGHLNKKNQTINGIIQDITENKKLEIEKSQKEELLYQQSKMAAMGEMLGNIAHQWRQPLSAISTASTGIKLQKELGVLEDKEFFKAVDSINNSAQYLSQTIDDFRYFFSMNHQKNLFKLESAIDKTLNLVNAQFIAKEIEIIKELKEVEVYSLENELIQVLINILNNARDALTLRDDIKRLIFIKIYIENSHAIIEILDNAGGIEENIIGRIFEPYFTTKYKAQGTGIGLYMSEEIVRKHLNGEIMVENKVFKYENKEYKGANFKIVLNEIVE